MNSYPDNLEAFHSWVETASLTRKAGPSNWPLLDSAWILCLSGGFVRGFLERFLLTFSLNSGVRVRGLGSPFL